MKMKINQLISTVNKMNKGEEAYINAINLSPNAISELRSMIQKGILKLNEEELQKHIVPKAWDEYRTGTSICPQMFYIKG